MPIERLGPADLSMVWPEDFGWPQDIGAIAVLEGSSLVEASGRFRIDDIRDRIGRRLQTRTRASRRV